MRIFTHMYAVLDMLLYMYRLLKTENNGDFGLSSPESYM